MDFCVRRLGITAPTRTNLITSVLTIIAIWRLKAVSPWREPARNFKLIFNGNRPTRGTLHFCRRTHHDGMLQCSEIRLVQAFVQDGDLDTWAPCRSTLVRGLGEHS